ncbi:MAG: ComEA family DNA-binding protein [Gammaproteobacteria bacterium]|nr:ComEA family DNA-binding protein [Gammaproteobacteria bacterium]
MNIFRILVLAATFVFATAAWSAAIDINTATSEQLAELKGIGSKKAQAIVNYRNQHGQFSSADELVNVKGIGLKIVEKNRTLIEVRH